MGRLFPLLLKNKHIMLLIFHLKYFVLGNTLRDAFHGNEIEF